MAKPRTLQDIDQLYNKIDEITDEILPNQLMNKSTYDADNDGIVDKADAANTATNASNLKKSDGTTVDADTITTKLLKIPTYNGNTNQVLTSNGDGTASWKDAQGGDIGYDNAESGLTSTDVQGAIDEVNSHMKTGINDVKAQLTSGEHEFRFGITADGEYGYHKEVEGADTVVPFKNSDFIIPYLYFHDNGGDQAYGHFILNTEKYSKLILEDVYMKNYTDNYYVEIVVMDPINNNVIFRLSPGSTTAAKTWKNQIIDVSNYDSIKFHHRVFVADIKITNLRLE